MKKLIFILLLISHFTSGQVRQGYYNAAFGETRVGTDRTTWGKAYLDGLILKKLNPDSLVVVLPPRQWIVEIPEELESEVILIPPPNDDPVFITSIRVFNITNTSAQLDFEVNQPDYDEVIFAIKKDDGSLDWQSHILSEMFVESSLYYTREALEPNTTYMYSLYVTKGDQEFNSKTYKFTTLE